MPIKSSHRVNGYNSRECDNEETVSCKEEEEDEEEEEEEEDDDDEEDDVSEREYFEKLHNLTNQLRQLNEGVHPELCKASKRAENWLSDQRLRIQILHEHKIDEVHCQYEREIKVCEQDCATEKRRIREYLMSLCEDLKKRLEHDKKNIELTPTGDVLELKPAVTRKLRRRTPESAASCGTKFGYWGDILLYGSSWTLPSASKTLSSSDSGAGQSQPTSVGTPLSPPPTKVGESEPGDQNAPTSAPASGTCGSNANLFGSLSVNVEDSSLMTHLLASLNAASDNGSGVGGLSSAGAYFASSLNQSGSALSGILSGGPASSTGGSGGGLGASAFGSAGGGGGGTGSGTVGLGFLSAAAPATSAAVLGFPSAAAAAAALVGAGVGCLQPPKRRKQQTSQPFTQLTLLLPENDIYSDLTAIHRACGKPPVANAASKKHGGGGSSAGCASGCGLSVDGSPSSRVGGSSPSSCRGDSGGRDVGSGGPVADGGSRRKETSDACSGADNFSPPTSFSSPAVWIDDGRLYCGQTCFQQGASVHIEGHGCSGTIVAIGAQDVSIKRSSDHGIVRITVQQLKQGRYTLVPKR
ncbi:Sin3 histone deacetylase corepressor complex component SDS3 [Sparganum proliferum]